MESLDKAVQILQRFKAHDELDGHLVDVGFNIAVIVTIDFFFPFIEGDAGRE